MGRKKLLNSIDAGILMEVYRDDYTILKFVQDFLTKIHCEKQTLLYHLRKLVKLGLIQEVKTYPKSWRGIDEDTRREAEDMIVKVQRLLR